jgi:hypothetical protein
MPPESLLEKKRSRCGLAGKDFHGRVPAASARTRLSTHTVWVAGTGACHDGNQLRAAPKLSEPGCSFRHGPAMTIVLPLP